MEGWRPVAELTRWGFAHAQVVMANEAHDGLRRCVRTREVGIRMIRAAHQAGVRRLAMEALPWPAEGDPDWEWRTAAEDSPEQLRAEWQAAVDRSRTLVAEAIADGGLGRLASYTSRDGRHPSLRRLLMDMIEEYARHVGHADLIRESVDGLVGEDPE